MSYPVLLLQPRDLENDTKSVHSYDEASLAAGQTYQVCNVDPLEHIYMLDLFREIESFSQECFDWSVMLTFRPWMFHCWSLWRIWQRMQMTVKRRMNLDIQKVGKISITDPFSYLISQYFLWIYMLKYDFYPEICMSYFFTTEKYEKKFYILISKCYWLFLIKRKIGYQ